MSLDQYHDSLRYAMGIDLADPRPKTATEIAMRANEAMDHTKYLTEQIRRLMYAQMMNAMFQPLVMDAKQLIPLKLDLKALGDNRVKPKKAEKFNTIGVRFLNDPTRIYSYKVRIGSKVQLGQELVVDTDTGTKVVAVVQLDKTPNPAATKYVERKTVAL